MNSSSTCTFTANTNLPVTMMNGGPTLNGAVVPIKNGFSATNNSHAAENGETMDEGAMLKTVLDIVLRNKLVTGINSTEKVVEFKHPKELKTLLDVKLERSGCSLEKVKALLEQVVHYSVKTQHPHFYNQLYGGIDEVALTGAWMTEALNTNQYTFEVAPVFMLVEDYMSPSWPKSMAGQMVMAFLSKIGSISNMYAMVMARFNKYPDIKSTGVFGLKPLVAFTSDQLPTVPVTTICPRVDSAAWNPHKMLGISLQCSIFLTRHKGLLHKFCSAQATYLFQQDKHYGVTYDTGDKIIRVWP
ncbi:Cysteine sulfinic acid decarboxylase-like 1 [Homarus americanus]|uniref:Cysteine sulfinic acid decarboxylase-like 1 n=1 Tax=Homarus americanus TaxID=6706 RepID=A0A8J5MZS0_HOMAM|nr:Cysteine sulfinic acid decarboxylase-like 1 [Homarus americanus]